MTLVGSLQAFRHGSMSAPFGSQSIETAFKGLRSGWNASNSCRMDEPY